jgi:serine/threonine-protein kinase HipA
LLPENEARLKEIEAEYGVSRDDPYSMLAHVGEDCVGAVQFAAPERAATIASGSADAAVEWLDEAKLEMLLRQVAARPSPSGGAAHTGQFSLPGALGKVALVWDQGRKQWGLPSGRRASTHILKPPMAGVEGHNENEHFSLELARAVGLPAAISKVVRFGEQRAISVERFDRRTDPNGDVRRVHQEDIALALGLNPALKYAAEAKAGVAEIVTLLRSYAPHDVSRFVLDVGFAWITAWTDAHLRNFSLLIYPGGEVALSPLYDVASALGLRVHKRWVNNRDLGMAMSIGGHTSLEEIGRGAWGREVKRSRLSRSTLTGVAALAERVAEEAPLVAARIAEEDLDARYLASVAKRVRNRALSCAAELSRTL